MSAELIGKRVNVYKWHRELGETQYTKVLSHAGTFCGFGVAYEEFESGPGNYSTALVLLYNGMIENVGVEMVHFVDFGSAT
jgi:hypothetical protein